MQLFWYLLDLSIVNAYVLECESPNHLPPPQGRGKKKKNVFRTQKLFMLVLARELIGDFSARKSLGRPSSQIPSLGRYTERHMPTKFSNLVRCKQCHTPDKIKRTQYGCLECGVHLCPVPCFRDYHTQKLVTPFASYCVFIYIFSSFYRASVFGVTCIYTCCTCIIFQGFHKFLCPNILIYANYYLLLLSIMSCLGKIVHIHSYT